VITHHLTPGDSFLAAPKPISVILTSEVQERVHPGERVDLGVTVCNQGAEAAIIEVVIDERDRQLRDWGSPLQKRLALGPDQSGEVTFSFSVPADTAPGIYSYDLVIDARQAYPEFAPLRYRQRQFQVLLSEDQSLGSNDPTLALEPRTTPETPQVLRGGEPAFFQVWVENRSERVDRVRLLCTGLPEGWQTKIQYPTGQTGLGLVIEADSLGLNPGDRSCIQLQLTPAADALAGPYSPTLRLTSENQPDLGLLDLIYLQVSPIYLVQPQMQILQGIVRDRPARFAVQIANSGNTDRRIWVQVRSLEEEGSCSYHLEWPDRIANLAVTPVEDRIDESEGSIAPHCLIIPPRSVSQVLVTGQPHYWWLRPWLGTGKLYNFQVDLTDDQQLPIVPKQLSSSLTWAPRPKWQFLLALIGILGSLGAIAGLIWWLFFRTVPAQLLEFAAEDAQYFAANQDSARVRWQIENPQSLGSIEVSGYSPEGQRLSGPLVYDLSRGLPAVLQDVCTQQANILRCGNVRTDARQPGQYRFELSLQPKKRGNPIVKPSSLVTIYPKPLPLVQELTAQSLAYREAGAMTGLVSGSDQAIPAIGPGGIALNWIVRHVQDLEALKLVGRDGAGAINGQLWLEFQDENGDGRLDLPAALQPYCKLTDRLTCVQVPTGVTRVGSYQFELIALEKGASATGSTGSTTGSATGSAAPPTGTAAKPIQTEQITIHPRPALISQFRINGSEAQAKYRVPVPLGAAAPAVQLDWRVEGGSTTTVELQPSPGSVQLQGAIVLPLNQQYGVTPIVLQVTDGAGKQIRRSISIETFNPNPVDPSAAAAAAVAAAARVTSESNAKALQRNAQMSAQATADAVRASQASPPPLPVRPMDQPNPKPIAPLPVQPAGAASGSEVLSPGESSPGLR
jgi:hypothetical protein